MEHYRVYPKLQIRDTFKFLHQSSFGCEHLVTNPETVNDYIIKESEAYSCHRGNLTEPLDGAYCRVHLDWIESGLSPKTLGKLFFLSEIFVDLIHHIIGHFSFVFKGDPNGNFLFCDIVGKIQEHSQIISADWVDGDDKLSLLHVFN